MTRSLRQIFIRWARGAIIRRRAWTVDLTQPHPQFLRPLTMTTMRTRKRGRDAYGGRRAVLTPAQRHTGARALAPSRQLRNAASLRSAINLLSAQPICDGCVWGSNQWVISGKHTASGKPLLSNDMHIRLTEPNIWYMADLKAPGFHAAGVTLPGLPFVVAGHNDHVAWGFTALMGDVQDLYEEKLDGKGNYEGNDAQWHPLAVNPEVIYVRGSKDVVVHVQSTGHGPIVNAVSGHDFQPIALKWTIYDPTLNAIPLYAMNVASNWSEFSAALTQWAWPTQNLVYADDQGHIAYHAVGKVPVPFLGNEIPFHHGDLDTRVGTNEFANPSLAPGTYFPFDLMPHAFDPPSGLLATANSRVTPDGYPYPLTHEWIDPYRIERIYKSLDGRDHLTPADMIAVQTDIYSAVDQELGQRFAYAIDHTNGVDDRLRRAADLMRSWDGKLTLDSAAASIVTQTRAALWPLILDPKLGKEAADYHWAEKDFALEEIVMHAKTAWLPKDYKNWDALLTEAVRRGMERGKAPADVAQWKYGSWHVIEIEHPLVQFLPFLTRIAGTGPQPITGDTLTVKQISPFVGPSQRFTMDCNNIDGSTEDIVLGESSDPLSPYFRDQWSAWYGGTTFALPYTPAAVARADYAYVAADAMNDQGSENRDQRSARWGWVLIPLAAFVAIVPQLIRGNSCGHDFNVHLVSWLDCLNAWKHGLFYPHWTPSANYGAGEPRFVFYPPLTWMLGAALGAIFPWSFAPIAFTFLCLAATGLATRALALEALDDARATLAGCAAIFSGFALFTAYERAAFPEFTGGVWLPLLLLFALRDRSGLATEAPCPIASRFFSLKGGWIQTEHGTARLTDRPCHWPSSSPAHGSRISLSA